MVVPELDCEFFQQVLRKYENNNDIRVQKISKSEACPAGNNFIAAVNRILVDGFRNGKDYSWSVIAKEFPEDSSYDVRQAFENEYYAYTQILPTLNSYCTNPLSFPSCLYATKNIIILEDLSQDGFKNVNKYIGMSYDNIISTLKELANFHASSIIMKHKDKSKFEALGALAEDLIFKSNPENPILKSQGWCLEIAIKLITNNITLNNIEEYSKRINILKKLRGNTYKPQYDVIKKNREFSVINHGDTWCNNILIKKNEVKLIDLQAPRMTSVAADLSYFLYINMDPSLRIKKLDELLKIYLNELNKSIKAANLNLEDKLTMEWLTSEMNEFHLYGFMHGTWLLPVFFVKDLSTFDPNNLENMDPEMKRRVLVFALEYTRYMLTKPNIKNKKERW